MKTVVLGEGLETILLAWVIGALWCIIWLLLCLTKGRWIGSKFLCTGPFEEEPPYSVVIFLIAMTWWTAVPVITLKELSKRIDVWARKKIALAKEKELDN